MSQFSQQVIRVKAVDGNKITTVLRMKRHKKQLAPSTLKEPNKESRIHLSLAFLNPSPPTPPLLPSFFFLPLLSHNLSFMYLLKSQNSVAASFFYKQPSLLHRTQQRLATIQVTAFAHLEPSSRVTTLIEDYENHECHGFYTLENTNTLKKFLHQTRTLLKAFRRKTGGQATASDQLTNILFREVNRIRHERYRRSWLIFVPYVFFMAAQTVICRAVYHSTHSVISRPNYANQLNILTS